jgi:hypothetical protein
LPDLLKVPVQRVLEFARKLPYRTRLGAAAQQILTADNQAPDANGVVVRLEPELNSFLLTQKQLDDGSIVGRFRKLSGGAIRRFALGSEDRESFWIVYRQGERYVGRFISASMDTSYTIVFDHHLEPEEGLNQNLPWAQAIAQFEYLTTGPGPDQKRRGDGALPLLVEGGGTAWVSCTANGCCRVN